MQVKLSCCQRRLHCMLVWLGSPYSSSSGHSLSPRVQETVASVNTSSLQINGQTQQHLYSHNLSGIYKMAAGIPCAMQAMGKHMPQRKRSLQLHTLRIQDHTEAGVQLGVIGDRHDPAFVLPDSWITNRNFRLQEREQDQAKRHLLLGLDLTAKGAAQTFLLAWNALAQLQ